MVCVRSSLLTASRRSIASSLLANVENVTWCHFLAEAQ